MNNYEFEDVHKRLISKFDNILMELRDRLERSVKQTITRSGREVKNSEEDFLQQCFNSCLLSSTNMGFGDIIYLLIEIRFALENFVPLQSTERNQAIFISQYLGRHKLITDVVSSGSTGAQIGTMFHNLSSDVNKLLKLFKKHLSMFFSMYQAAFPLVGSNSACGKSCGTFNRFFSETFGARMYDLKKMLQVADNIGTNSPVQYNIRGIPLRKDTRKARKATRRSRRRVIATRRRR